MTQEEKSILLKDLCARLPYGVEVYYTETVPISTLKTINSEKGTCIVYDHSQWYRHSKFHIEEIKPYLRPMSSMTEEEKKELQEIAVALSYNKDDIIVGTQINSFRQLDGVLELFNSHHLDWRGLIEKGLALEAPKDMYKKLL
jgi:hypothetical protein